MRKYLLIVISILIAAAGTVEAQEMAEQVSAPKLADKVVQEFNKVQDFKGEIRAKVYGQERTFIFRTKVMKSSTRLMTQQVQKEEISDSKVERLLNTIPWVYLPPDYSTVAKTLPISSQLSYQNPMENLKKLYDLELLGESIYQEREVYIIQLRNKFFIQRLYIDKKWNTVSRVEIFNSSNIKIFDINYKDFKSFSENLWLPTEIEIKKALGKEILEITYHDWQVNKGLTDFDFARGFQDDYQAKIANLKQELEEKPQADSIYWKISQIYKENNRLDKAISNLRNAIRINDQITYRQELIQLLQAQGRYKEAIGEVKAALQLDYNNADLYYLLGELHLQQNNSDQARYFLEKAVNLDPGNISYLEKLFWVYYNSAENDNEYMLERAASVVDKLISLQPENEDYRVYQGDVFSDQDKLIEAVKSYQKAIDLAPEDTWGYIKLADFYQQTGSYHKAEDLYRYIVYLDDSIKNHRRLANLYFEYGKYKLALKEYKLIDSRTTNDYESKLKLAETYFASGNRQTGLEISQQIIKDFKQGEAYLETAQMIENYNVNDSLQIYYQALQNKSILNEEQEDKLYRGFGDMFFKWQQKIRQKELEQLLKLPTQREIYQLLGRYQLQNGNLNEAITNYRSALEFADKLTICSDLALSYLIMGDYEQVEQEITVLIQAGKLEKTEEIISVIEGLKDLQARYEEKYVPGRLKRLAGDKLRREGNLKQAVIEYKQAIFENYNYELPYFYLTWIYSLQDNQFEQKLVAAGLDGEEVDLLKKLLNLFPELEK